MLWQGTPALSAISTCWCASICQEHRCATGCSSGPSHGCRQVLLTSCRTGGYGKPVGLTALQSRRHVYGINRCPVQRQQWQCQASAQAPATVTSVFDSLGDWAPLAELGALAGAAVGIYFFLRILLWDYKERGTDYEDGEADKDSFTIPGMPRGIKASVVPRMEPSVYNFDMRDLTAPSGYRPRVRDPRLQALAREATLQVLAAISEVRALWHTQLTMQAVNSNGVLWRWVRLWLAEHASPGTLHFGTGHLSMGFDAIAAQLACQVAMARAVQQAQKLGDEVEHLEERFSVVTIRL